MKLLNNIKNNKAIVVLLSLTTAFSSCSDYLDVDKDTDNPTVAPLNYLLTNVETKIGEIGDFSISTRSGTGSPLSTYTHQMTSREDEDQYGLKVDDDGFINDWNSIYLTLNDIETLIKQGTESGDLVYVGIAQMQKAYILSYAVDLWGDVPYSETSQLTGGIIAPKFDNQKEIYTKIFTLIETAKDNLASDAGLKKPANDDIIYLGDTEKWIKFANTFKLKLYNQTRLTSDFDQTGFNALIAENNFFTSEDDDFQINHFNKLSPTNERNKLFIESYEGTQFGSYQSPWMYEILKGMNPNIHTDNPDPRIPYYYFNQLVADELPVDQGDNATGDPNADYWDASTGFFSIRFGSTGPDRDKSAENSYTYPGIFSSGGRYDDGEGGKVDDFMTNPAEAPTGIAPHRILTYNEFLFIQAELIQVGKLTNIGTAAAKLEEAITASFAKVDQVVLQNQAVAKTQTIPVLIGSDEVNTFIENILIEFNAASPAKKLEIIMTQKWVGTFGDPADQYTDYRRTGFPVLADPKSTTKEYQLDNEDGFPLIDSQTVLNNPFQLSIYWPQSELNSNANAPAQKNPTTYKIFWDN